MPGAQALLGDIMAFWQSRPWRRQHRLGACLLFALSGLAHAGGLSFDQALQLATSRAPQLMAQQATLDGTKEASIAADALPDPKLFGGVDNLPVDTADRFSLNRDFMTMQKIGVMQDLPNGDKRRALADEAVARVAEAKTQLGLTVIAVRTQAAQAWLNRYYLGQQLAILDKLDQENQLLDAAVRAQVAAGKGMTADVLLPKQEAVDLANRHDNLRRDIAKADAMLRRWVGDSDTDGTAGDPPAFAIDAATLRQHIGHHPDLERFQPMQDMATAELHEAEAARKSDWSVELAYAHRPDFSNMVSLQVSATLPLFTGTRQDPQIRAKRKEVDRIEADREDMLREHRADLESDLADYTALSQQLDRAQNTAIPIAEQKIALQMAAYRSGRGDLAAVLAARREAWNTRLDAIALASQRDQLAAKLHFLFVSHEDTAP
jgi:outer membrane protein TolC